MEAIQAAHFSMEPLECAVCTDPVLFKTPEVRTPPRFERMALKIIPRGMDGEVQVVRPESGGPVRLAPRRYNRRARREAIHRRKNPVEATLQPHPPSPWRGARYYLGHNCSCKIVICVACAERFRDGRVDQVEPRYYIDRAHRCPGCSVEVTWGMKSRSFVTGADRHRLLELKGLQDARTLCRYLFSETSSYCPFGRECRYSHLDPRTGEVRQQHEPGKRQRAVSAVRVVRRVPPSRPGLVITIRDDDDDIALRPALPRAPGVRMGPPPALPLAGPAYRPPTARPPVHRRPAILPPLLLPAGAETEEDWSEEESGDILAAIRAQTALRLQQAAAGEVQYFSTRPRPRRQQQ